MAHDQGLLKSAVAEIACEVTEHTRQFAHKFGHTNGWNATQDREAFSLSALMFHAVAVAATRTLSGALLPDTFEADLVDQLHRALVNDFDFADISVLGASRSQKLFVNYYAQIAVTLGRAEEAGARDEDDCERALQKAAQLLFQGMFGAQATKAHAPVIVLHLDKLLFFYRNELGLAPQ